MIDLRSDTVTLPCKEMLRAMSEAKAGDDFYKNDAATNELEAHCADFFGVEAALFMASGTLANQVAIRCHTTPGDDIITDETYHVHYYESASTVDLGKVVLNTVRSPDGILDVSCIERGMLNKHRSNLSNHVSLICLENSINYHGGKIFPLEEAKLVYQFAKTEKIKVHLDGARLLNACAALGVSPNEYIKNADTTMISFSKGLGAPFGAILLGSAEDIHKAVKFRKWYGGGLHQSGFMAAAGLFGLKNNIGQLALDNAHATLLAKQLQGHVVVKPTETNMVMFDVEKLGTTSHKFVHLAQSVGLLLYPWSKYCVRAVTHNGISRDDIIWAADKILEMLS